MDEELLRAYTNLGIQDTIRAFQQYIYNHIDNQVCHQKIKEFLKIVYHCNNNGFVFKFFSQHAFYQH